MLSVIMLSVNMLKTFVPGFALFYCYAECRYAECPGAVLDAYTIKI